MDGVSLLALPNVPASGLQVFALFVNFFFPALALLVVSVRVVGRLRASQFALDDWLVCIAMLMSVAETVISFFFIKTNFIGIRADQIPAQHDPTQGLIWAYAVQILYNPILALVKSSVLLFLSRLFGQKDGVRRFLLWLNVANVSQMMAVFFAITLQCLPIAFNWDLTIRGGRCVDRRVLYTTTAVFNIVTDLLILGTPIWIFSKLKIPRRTKMALLFVFLLGFLVTITSIVRLVLLVQGLFGLVSLPDASGNVGFVTSVIETNLALITASAPALRPFFRSRERGGWGFPRPGGSVMSRSSRMRASQADLDLEAGKKSVGWDSPPPLPVSVGSGVGGKFGRGGSLRRGSGRRGNGRKAGTGGRGGGKLKPIIRVRTDMPPAIELAKSSASPLTSDDEMILMTREGAMRMSDIQREIDGIAKEIGAARSPRPGTSGSARSAARPSTAGNGASRPRPSVDGARPGTSGGAQGTKKRPSMESLRRPGTSGGGGAGVRPGAAGGVGTGPAPVPPAVTARARYPPERYYSESLYADDDFEGRDDRNYNEDRISRYGDRRFGVVTPKGTTPTTRGWEGTGRPF